MNGDILVFVLKTWMDIALTGYERRREPQFTIQKQLDGEMWGSDGFQGNVGHIVQVNEQICVPHSFTHLMTTSVDR